MEADGGWIILNFEKHRAIRDAEERRIQVREAVRRHRARVRELDYSKRGKPRKPRLSQAEAEAEAEAEAVEVKDIDKAKDKTAGASAPWVRQLGGLWRSRYKGEPPWGRIGKELQPVKDAPDLKQRFAAYLAETEARYVNLQKFVETFGSWGNGKRIPQTYDYTPGQSGPAL
jgi:hypothetical protein